MRIAIFTNNYLPNPYGVPLSIERFRGEFERLGHEVYIFAPRWKGYKDANPRVFRYPSIETDIKIKFPIAVPYSRKISRALESLDLDIIHSQHPNLLGSAAARWARRKNIPLIFTWHTLYDQYAHFAPFIPARLAAWWMTRGARNYANNCDAVVTPTPSVIGIIREWGVTNKNITAVPTGVEERAISKNERNKVREKHGVKDDEILLTVITRFTKEKNVEFLTEAVTDVLKGNVEVHPVKSREAGAAPPQFNRVKFMLVGKGNLLPRLKAIVRKKNLEDRVIFSGFIPWEGLKGYFAAGDIFVYGSKSETQGTVLTEAMYAGLPIVAVRASGSKDIVEDGKTGFLVAENKKEFSDAVQKLVDDESLRRNFFNAAKEIAREKYTSKVCAGKLLEVYEKAIANHK